VDWIGCSVDVVCMSCGVDFGLLLFWIVLDCSLGLKKV